MKKTRMFKQDGKLIVQSQQATDPVIASARLAKEAPQQPVADSWHLARIPAHLLTQWVKEAGISYDDREAVKDLLMRKIMDSDNAAFRVHEGRVQ